MGEEVSKGMGKSQKVKNKFRDEATEDKTAAALGSSYTSVTLAPNVYVNYTPEISLLDMAGYLDTRDFIGVIGVSYFLKAVFEKVRKAKFLIVFDEHRLME